ncbi:type I restriction endonuclease subunit R [Planctomycetes bacterium TBK1r]|uniref:Type I restriction enzyme endonuclease subunit n=1 Tax=Stieleria magnilauensis TaxID=2527963 RepID=A0ABX5XU84_9BACT|nr:Type I restriction enzyme R protein [Planctomycetes bacterium TBK1r]
MSGDVNKPERETQNRVIRLLRDTLKYDYLGDWDERSGNSNIEDEQLRKYLAKQDYTTDNINAAILKLKTEANNSGRSLYDNNEAVYKLLRYGVDVKTKAGESTAKVWLIDWDSPENNDFAVAEEVTLTGPKTRRPDVVLYINGIAIGVLELKNSRTSIGHGIRQNLSNQKPEFNQWFFSTVQFVFAGNDTQGVRYGTIGTPEKFFLSWKEDEHDSSGYLLDKYLTKMCRKDRILELMHDFVLFDGGVKKLPRVHQYFGIKAAQDHVRRREGGVIWHTQGSGKSIVMVLLAKWILENNPNARIAVITDRDELDKQMLANMRACGLLSDSQPDGFYHASSGRDLVDKLCDTLPRVVSSLVHKFGKKDVDDFDAYIKDLEAQPTKTVGEIFVFVDECHRTQSGKLHRVMKAIMPNAVFIGFTGTPLLKKDKKTSLEVFGRYIHEYKFDEAVEDKVVLDLIYEARDIDQRLGSEDKIDQWFEAKTRGLNDWQKDELKKKWGTMQSVLSSRSRMSRVVSDIVFDFSCKPRVSSQRGNAILVAKSIYEACKYFTLFNDASTGFKGKCAVITSYNPQSKDITLEDTGANTETDKEFIYNTYEELLKDVDAKPGKTKTETYEDRAKALFTQQPANMKLLVVVDKLLTGFDAPSCTYLYIDKTMRDHGLFQAICRTNRLDGEDKEFGYIVDYMDLFKNLVNEKGTGALQVYTSDLDHELCKGDPEIAMKDRLKTGKEKLDDALEQAELLCEPVQPPKTDLDHIRYFCGNTEVPTDLKAREPQRAAMYKAIASLVRAYANLADELNLAGYTDADVARLKGRVNHFVKLRDVIRNAAGETLDLKAYEADMRHLIDTYIEADEPRKISDFDEMGVLEVITKSGMDKVVDHLSNQLGGNQTAVAETIENNVRSKIIKEQLNDPAYYERMSKLLDEVIEMRRSKAIDYEEYLKRIGDLAKRVELGGVSEAPPGLDTRGKLAVYNMLVKILSSPNQCTGTESTVAEPPQSYDAGVDNLLKLALAIDETVRRVRPHGWKGVQAKEAIVYDALYQLLSQNDDHAEQVFQVLLAQEEY